MPLNWNRISKLWGGSVALICLLALLVAPRMVRADVVTPNGTINYTATRSLSGTNYYIASPTFAPPSGYSMGKVSSGNYAQLTNAAPDGATPVFSPNSPSGAGVSIMFTVARVGEKYLLDVNGILTTGGKGKGKGTIPWAANEIKATVTAVAVATANGATQTNMKQNYPSHGDQNWGIVKKVNTSVIVRVTTSPNTDAVWKHVQWQRGSPVTGHDNERSYSTATSTEYKIKPTINGVGTEPRLNLWVIWSTVTIDLVGKISPDDQAAALVGGNWPANMGGGNALGPLNFLQNNHLIVYTIGKYEANATLEPSGVWDAVATGAWGMDRTVDAVAYENGGHYVNGVWQPGSIPTSGQDNSAASWQYLKPTDKNGGSIFDLDAPALHSANRTSEVYANFQEYAIVTLDKQYTCSDQSKFYYEARVDGDIPSVPLNALGNGSITLPNMPFFPKR